MEVRIDAGRIGLSPDQTYNGLDILKNQTAVLKGHWIIEMNGADATLYKFKLE